MHSFILENTNQMPFHTDMRRVFECFQGQLSNMNWLITDVEYYKQMPDEHDMDNNITYPSDALEKDVVWIEGEELTKILYGNDIQFVWAVFSGFHKDIRINLEELEETPYADGNPGFWISDPKIQHPLAEIEIVCWDSSLTLFFSREEPFANTFSTYFTDAIDLRAYNNS
ncbi:hypothetical protein [Paenibacillus sp. QZ-Y1]|uniref:hypothetical protein n=1 Tax=Paenibacillus sp. QZ-Y1 TaxID=3414511 RepID=UPI003F7924AB